MRSIVESYRRKLNREEGWVLKRGAQLRIALCYPNVYSIGMANLGFQAMYEIFNNIPEVSCERVFLPDSGVRSLSVSEGEILGPKLVDAILENESKDEVLLSLARQGRGFYVPSLYDVSYHDDGTVAEYTRGAESIPICVGRAI